MTRSSYLPALLVNLALLVGCVPDAPDEAGFPALDQYDQAVVAAACAYQDQLTALGGDSKPDNPKPDGGKQVTCPACNGSGRSGDGQGVCGNCGGSGKVDENEITASDLIAAPDQPAAPPVASAPPAADAAALVSEAAAPPSEPARKPEATKPADFMDVRNIRWVPPDMAAVAKLAREEQKIVMIHVTMPPERCAPCRLLERDCFPDPRVIAATQNFVCVKVGHTHPWARSMGIRWAPSDIFVRINGDRWEMLANNNSLPTRPDAYAAYLTKTAKTLR